MKIPDSFKNKIANTFYDKELTLYSVQSLVDDEGFARDDAIQVSSTFKGNVRFDKLDRIQQDFGLQETIDMVVTTNDDIPENSVIGYLGKAYKAMRVIKYDSHNYIIAKIWSSKSPTWISS